MAVGSEQVEEGSGQKAGDLQPNPAACREEQSTDKWLQMEWDENLGTSRDYTELFITQGVSDFTANKNL